MLSAFWADDMMNHPNHLDGSVADLLPAVAPDFSPVPGTALGYLPGPALQSLYMPRPDARTVQLYAPVLG